MRVALPYPMLAVSAIVLAALVWAGGPSTVLAESAEEAGLRIATDARERQKGYGNLTANLKMTLRNKRGQESTREVRLKVIEVEGDGDRTMFVFDRPRDVKGTAFLVHAHKNEPDDQWLYLPALKRVKRISSSKQSGSFMGSEFSYEDLSAVEVEKYTHRYLRDEACGDLQCAVLERVPLSRGFRVLAAARLARPGGASHHSGPVLRPQGRASQDDGGRRVRAISRPLLAGRQGRDDEPSHGKEHRAELDGLRVRNGPRRGRLHQDGAEARAIAAAPGHTAIGRPGHAPGAARPESDDLRRYRDADQEPLA